MGDVVLVIDETYSKLRVCRICHEEEEECFFEVPCACSGTVKFAHRDCIQRWCDEKGDTTCEICLQVYRNGYTAVSKQSKLIEEVAFTIRGNGRRRSRRLVSLPESAYSQFDYVDDRGVNFCRSLALIFSAVLLMGHTLDVIYGAQGQEYALSALKVVTIIFPIFIVIRTIVITIKNNIRRHQYPESEEDMLSFDDDELEADEEGQQYLLA